MNQFLYSLVRNVHQIKERLLFNRNQFILNMQLLNDILQKNGFSEKYWLIGGVVLGFIREGRLLDHDSDVDFGIWESDHETFKKLIPKLRAAGFKPLFRWTNNNGQITEYCFMKDRAKFEFFIHFTDTSRPYLHWYAYELGQKVQLLRQMFRYETKSTNFLNCRWLIPSPPEKYLEDMYGNWKEPDKNFDYAEEGRVPCNIEKVSWSGSYKWE